MKKKIWNKGKGFKGFLNRNIEIVDCADHPPDYSKYTIAEFVDALCELLTEFQKWQSEEMKEFLRGDAQIATNEVQKAKDEVQKKQISQAPIYQGERKI